jgi:hypothetical protein
MDLKTKIYHYLMQTISEKISGINEALLLARESRDSDTKSSAGDKHETSRALAQIEIDKLEVQLNKTLMLEKELRSINLNKKYDRVEMGSLVITNHEAYFISIGIGKLEVEDKIFYAISLNSPIGEVLKFKMVGDKVFFQGREIVIEEII